MILSRHIKPGLYTEPGLRKNERKKLSMTLCVMEKVKENKERIKNGLTDNFVAGLFFTGLICLKIYESGWRFLPVVVPAVMYGLWYGWKNRRFNEILFRNEVIAVTIIIAWTPLFIILYKNRGYFAMSILLIAFLPFYIKGIVKFIMQSIRALRGEE